MKMTNRTFQLWHKGFCIILAALFLLCGCTPESPGEPNVEPDSVVVDPYALKTIRINDNTENIKILGVRHLPSDEVLYTDYSSSGIQFNADCRNDLSISLYSNNPCYFKVYVDGELLQYEDSDYYTVDKETTITIPNLTEGLHSFRIIKVTGYTRALCEIRSLTLEGELKEAPADKDLYIEFLGDSITCGWGVIGNHSGAYTDQDSSLSYAHLVAEKLDADYSLFALSNCGVLAGSITFDECYEFASWRRDSENKYDFIRKADITIIELGTNDYTQKIPQEDFEKALSRLIERIYDHNGEDCKIMIIYNMKNNNYAASLNKIAQIYELPILKLKRSTNSKTYNHPSAAEHAAYVDPLVEFINNNR